MTSNLNRTRRRLTWLMIGLGVLDIIAVIALVSPWSTSPAEQRQEFESIRASIMAKSRQVVPPNQVQTRIDEARKQIEEFYKNRVPTENSVITEELGKLAAENHVNLTDAKYKAGDAAVSGLRRVDIDANLSGNYLQEVKFINALERSNILFLVNSVTLGEQEGGVVRLQLKLETYLKGRA